MNSKRTSKTAPKSAQELLDLYYLDIRSALIEAAAGMDRIQRADGGDEALLDPRLIALRDGCKLAFNFKGGRTIGRTIGRSDKWAGFGMGRATCDRLAIERRFPNRVSLTSTETPRTIEANRTELNRVLPETRVIPVPLDNPSDLFVFRSALLGTP